MPRQLITIAALRTTLLAALLPACHLLPSEPWMSAWPEQECTQEQQKLVAQRTKQCDERYIRRYCEGSATIEICLEDKE